MVTARPLILLFIAFRPSGYLNMRAAFHVFSRPVSVSSKHLAEVRSRPFVPETHAIVGGFKSFPVMEKREPQEYEFDNVTDALVGELIAHAFGGI